MLQKRKELKNCMKCLSEMQKELAQRKAQKKLTTYMDQLLELQQEVDKRTPIPGHFPIWESKKLPHRVKLEEYTITFSNLGSYSEYPLDNCGRELLEDALNARANAYAPYSNFKVGAAFRTKCGKVYSGCNVENVSLTSGCCAERTALLKGISEGYKCYNAGAVVALCPSGYTTPCGVCRQFIHEFSKTDMPIYVAQAPELSTQIPAFNDDDEVLVTSIYHLLPHSFTVY